MKHRRTLGVLSAIALLALILARGTIPEARTTGTISVRVLPESAEARVYVDGVMRGTTPLQLPHVSAGSHLVEVRAEGYRTWARTVEITAGGTAILDVALEAAVP